MIKIPGKMSWRLWMSLFAVAFLSACSTPSTQEGNNGPGAWRGNQDLDRFHVGDTVIVRFSGPGAENLENHQEAVKNDGNIALQQIGTIKAAGKTAIELQNELQEQYSKRYRYVTVTVEAVRYVYVSGQVNSPGRYQFTGDMTVLRAIATAGDFTNFARKKKVQVTRASGGSPITVNCVKAIDHPQQYDLVIYPGDQIHVPRRFF